MDTPISDPSAQVDDAKQRLVHRLREALIPALTEGSWSQIEADHKEVGLAWRVDLAPGWGKQKYVKHVLDDLSGEAVVAVARSALERFPKRDMFAVEDALLWIDAGGVARISEVTRLGLAKALDGQRIHPSKSPSDHLDGFARARGGERFDYGADGRIYLVDTLLFRFLSSGAPASPKASSHLTLLDTYGFRDWPDVRLFWFIESLVHPTIRQGGEQAFLVQALNAVLAADRYELFTSEGVSGHPIFRVRPVIGGVAGRPKNLIFASTGPKPEIGFVDAVNNDIVILQHAEHCLVYEEPIGDTGLRWMQLVEWWASREGLDPIEASTRKSLGGRLARSLGSEPERRLFNAYFKVLSRRLGDALPALVPQVYLHYDPVSLRELRARGNERRFDAQRMDFLLLLPYGVRVVIEIDGQQHYSTSAEPSAKSSPEEYARTVRGDRRLRLVGYQVYRFGGYEPRDESTCMEVVDDFFTQLFRRYKLLEST